LWDEEELESLRRLGLALPRPPLVERLILGDVGRSFDPKSKSLKPLFSIRVAARAVTVTFDLPYVEKKRISLTSTDSSVEVDAKLKAPATVRVGWTVQKRVRFERYKAHVDLPRTVDPEKAKATFRNGLLTVRFPVASSGSKVKIR